MCGACGVCVWERRKSDEKPLLQGGKKGHTHRKRHTQETREGGRKGGDMRTRTNFSLHTFIHSSIHIHSTIRGKREERESHPPSFATLLGEKQTKKKEGEIGKHEKVQRFVWFDLLFLHCFFCRRHRHRAPVSFFPFPPLCIPPNYEQHPLPITTTTTSTPTILSLPSLSIYNIFVRVCLRAGRRSCWSPWPAGGRRTKWARTPCPGLHCVFLVCFFSIFRWWGCVKRV